MQEQIQQYKQTFGVKEMKKWNNTMLWLWEYEFLKDTGAISDRGIITEYPMLIVIDKRSDLEKSQDYDGNLDKINSKLEELENQGYTAFIRYCPKKYTDYLNYKKNLNKQQIAQSYNEPPVKSLEQDILTF